MVGLARQQVAPARAAVGQQSAARREPPLDLRAVFGPRAGAQRSRSPSRPTETRARRRSIRAGSRPARHRSATRDRSPTRPGDSRPPPASVPSSARCRRASRAEAPATPGRRSPGTRCPGASVRVRSPERRAIRWTTRKAYVSSSLVPKSTSSTTPTAEATRATPSADQNESIVKPPLVSASAANSISASSTSTSTKPEQQRQRQTESRDERRQDCVQDRDHESGCQRPPGSP